MKKIACALLFASILSAQPSGKAPELKGNQWINTAGPIRLSERTGKVTIVHFWTFGCINCKHNLDAYNHWYRDFHDRGVEVIGIHTPELENERVAANVASHVKQFHIEYPVLIDNGYTNWNLWKQQFWPAVYVIDKRGNIRLRWDGELNYQNSGGEARVSRLVEQLLAE